MVELLPVKVYTFILMIMLMGINETLEEKILTVLSIFSVFFRRRLPVVMVRNHMAETLKAATTFIEQGRILNILSCKLNGCKV